MLFLTITNRTVQFSCLPACIEFWFGLDSRPPPLLLRHSSRLFLSQHMTEEIYPFFSFLVVLRLRFNYVGLQRSSSFPLSSVHPPSFLFLDDSIRNPPFLFPILFQTIGCRLKPIRAQLVGCFFLCLDGLPLQGVQTFTPFDPNPVFP